MPDHANSRLPQILLGYLLQTFQGFAVLFAGDMLEILTNGEAPGARVERHSFVARLPYT
jgi:hypothetical protein